MRTGTGYQTASRSSLVSSKAVQISEARREVKASVYDIIMKVSRSGRMNRQADHVDGILRACGAVAGE